MAVDLGDQVIIMLESLVESELSMRCTFSWAGGEYPCTAGPEKEWKRLDEGGYKDVATLSIKVRVVELPSGIDIPKRKQTILYKRNASAEPKKYRIASVTNFYGAVLQLDCEDPNQSS